MFLAYYDEICGIGATLEESMHDLESAVGQINFGKVVFYEGKQINVVLQKKEVPVLAKDKNKKETI